jgi:hypothetical protein
MSEALPFEGMPIQLGRQQYVLPRLSFKAMQASKARLQQIAGAEQQDPDVMQDAFVDVIHAALQRNYPELPRDVVEDALDWAIAPALFQQLMQMSVPAAPPGETTAESPSGASTGTLPLPKS